MRSANDGWPNGLNAALNLFHSGVLEKHGVELIAPAESIVLRIGLFRKSMDKIGLEP